MAGQLKTTEMMLEVQGCGPADVVRRSIISCLITQRHGQALSRRETTSRSSLAGVGRRWQYLIRCCLRRRTSCRGETSATYFFACSRYHPLPRTSIQLLWANKSSYHVIDVCGLYHNCDSTTIRHDYDEKLTCSFFARVESRRMEVGAHDTS